MAEGGKVPPGSSSSDSSDDSPRPKLLDCLDCLRRKRRKRRKVPQERAEMEREEMRHTELEEMELEEMSSPPRPMISRRTPSPPRPMFSEPWTDEPIPMTSEHTHVVLETDPNPSPENLEDWNWENFNRTEDINRSRALALLHSGHVPGRELLNQICKRSGRKSDFLQEICKKICHKIKQQSNDIIHVYPAYRPEQKHNIVFVVITKNLTVHMEVKDHQIYKREINECSVESKEIIKDECENTILDNPEIEKVIDCVEKHGLELMERHSNLTMVSVSGIQSSRYGKENSKKQEIPCIVLYTPIKGYIPLAEESFPTAIHGIPVDVREAFVTWSCGPRDNLDFLKMGCEIGSDVNENGGFSSGTLGGFVDIPDHGMCCITCAHVVCPGLNHLEVDGNHVLRWIDDGQQVAVFQPSLRTNEFGQEKIGHVINALFDSDNGVDAALIKLENRFPCKGDFPCAETNEFTPENPMKFSTGRTCELTRSKVVYKYGAATNITKGVVRLTRGNITRVRFTALQNDTLYVLQRQVEIKPTSDYDHFANLGDSGALVFVEDEDRMLSAVGLVEGIVSDSRTIVTPINLVLNALNVQAFKSFETI